MSLVETIKEKKVAAKGTKSKVKKKSNFSAKPKLLQISANTLAYFNNPEKLWMIHSGEVELYFIEITKERKALSPRTHIFKAQPGTIILSLSDQAFEGGVSIMGTSSGAKLIEYNISDIAALDKESVLEGLQNWVEGISTHYLHLRPPVDFTYIEPGIITNPRKKSKLAPAKGLIWAKIIDGQYNILGNVDLDPTDVQDYSKKTYIPVTKNFWISPIDKKGELEVFSSSDISIKKFFKKCINPLRRYCNTLIEDRFSEEKKHVKESIILRKKENEYLVASSLQKLKNILKDEEPVELKGGRKHKEDILFSAFQKIGDKMGKSVLKPKHFKPKDDATALYLMARASNMRYRNVILRGEWWKEENGHLLVYSQETGTAKAAIQIASGKYELHDPSDGSIKPVNEQLAKSLEPIGQMFFATFDRPIKSFRELVKFAFKGVKKDVLWLCFAAFLGSVIGLLIPILTNIIFDDIIPSADRGYLWSVFGILIIVALVQTLLDLAGGLLSIRLETKTNITVQAGIMDHLIRLPVRFFKKYSSGDLALRALTANSIKDIVSETLLSTTLSGAFSMVNIILLFYYDSRLTWIGLALALVGFIFIIIMGYLKLQYDRKLADVEGDIQGVLFQFLSGIDKIRISGAESRVFAIWAEKFKNLKTINFKSGSYQNWVEVFIGSFPFIANIFFFFFIYYYFESSPQDVSGLISVGAFIAFIAAYMQFLGTSLDMADSFVDSLDIIPLYERVKPILYAEPETGGEFKDLGKLNGDIEFNQVKFRYDPDQPLVLNNISFRIKAGEMVAFVGPSGSGKSTILKILLGFEKPTSGSVYYDGLEFSTLNKDLLRQQLGVVLQDGALMPGSIMKNIIGDSSLTINDAWEAAKMAGIEQDIREMPMGIHTVISEGSSTISGGQKQRIVIARAIVHRPTVIMMDEATSALDNRTQKIVKDSMDRLQATRIVVAHRLSTIENADRIFVMNKGKIVEEGSYEHLIKKKGLFAKLAKRQVV